MSLTCQLGCPRRRCERRATLAGEGWACTWLAGLGALDVRTPAEPEQHVHTAGWSRGAVIPCPVCRNRTYKAGPNGLPERECHGPEGFCCGHVWNPEESCRPPLASYLKPREEVRA